METLNGMGGVAEELGVAPEDLVGGLDLVQAARLLGIGVSTLRQRALSGQISYARDGKRWIFSWRDIAGYLERRHCSARPSEEPSATDNQGCPRLPP